MFETRNTAVLYVSIQAVLTLYASGCTTDVVLGLDLTVRDLIEHLQESLSELDYSFTTTIAERWTVGNIKEKLSYVVLAYADELQKAETSSEFEQNYKLPAGQDTTIGKMFRSII